MLTASAEMHRREVIALVLLPALRKGKLPANPPCRFSVQAACSSDASTRTTNTALTTDREALRTAFKAQKDAAFAGLDELQKLAEIGMKEYEDMRRSELSQAFRAIHEAAGAVGLKVQQLAETVGCEDYPNLNFKPTAKADARVQKLQAAINEIDIYMKDTAGKIMGVSALAAIAVENQGVALTGANLWPTFHALGDMARETESLIERVTA